MIVIQTGNRIERRLRIVRVAALVDLILLIALLTASFTGQRELVRILGPLHGINFLLLLLIVGVAALDGLWGWWFPLAVLLTAGPPGVFLGEWIIRRRMKQNTIIHDHTLPQTEGATTGKTTDLRNVPLSVERKGKEE